MKTFYLTNKARLQLEKPFGIPIFGKKKQVIKKFKEVIAKAKFKRIISVGDYTSLTLASDIKIFDGRIKRNTKAPIQKHSLSCFNPPASINKDVWKILKMALSKNKNVFIDGEEDLLVIPTILLAQKREAVVYGLANKGICLIEVCSKIKKYLRKLLKSFQKEKFKKIVLGGTFNKLHSGHRYFLSLAKYYGKNAIIGLCSDEMVKIRKKKFKEYLPFKERGRTLKNELNRIGLKSKIIEINDIYGPAIKDKEIEAILLTEETLANGIKINKIRKKNRLKELHYIILPYLLDKTGKKFSRNS